MSSLSRASSGSPGAVPLRLADRPWIGAAGLRLGELCVIFAWAAFVGRTYLSFDPLTMPAGAFNEFGTAVMSHAVWTDLGSCGLCVLWNGAINGGNPAFVELHGAPLHPLVIVTTLLWGTIVGAKVTVVGAMALAGLAQWWLGLVLRLGRLARLWSAMLVVTGSHLLARLDGGVVAVVLSTAACSLMLPPLLDLLLTGRRRSAVLFGLMLALALVAGQGYLQVGALLGLGPAVLLLLVWGDGAPAAPWRELLLALALAGLLAGVFLVPLAHFSSQLAKYSDPTFSSAQPLRYALLNLVIDDAAFYRSELLEKLPYPFLYVNYLGWIPLGLALLGVISAPRADRRPIIFLLAAVAGIYLTAAAVPLRLLALAWPDAAGNVRNPSLVAGLAFPLLAALAAYGIERLRRGAWPRRFRVGRVRWPAVALLLPLGWSLAAVYSFNRQWLDTTPRDPLVEPVLERLRADRAMWVALPHGQHAWVPPALDAGLKLTDVVRPWRWEGRSHPPAARAVSSYGPPGYQARVGELYIVAEPAARYATVRSGRTAAACSAQARGGNIDVDCRTTAPGTLEVQEHSWSGWQATRDGIAVPLEDSEWLRVAAPAGAHRYSFRYRPWDVALGALLSSVGVMLAGVLWASRPAAPATVRVHPCRSTGRGIYQRRRPDGMRRATLSTGRVALDADPFDRPAAACPRRFLAGTVSRTTLVCLPAHKLRPPLHPPCCSSRCSGRPRSAGAARPSRSPGARRAPCCTAWPPRASRSRATSCVSCCGRTSPTRLPAVT